MNFLKEKKPPIFMELAPYLYKEYGYSIGFKVVESGPLVRSSYHADEQARMVFNNG